MSPQHLHYLLLPRSYKQYSPSNITPELDPFFVFSTLSAQPLLSGWGTMGNEWDSWTQLFLKCHKQLSYQSTGTGLGSCSLLEQPLSPCTDHWLEYPFPYITSANDDQNAHNDAFGIWQMSWESGMSEEHTCTSLSCAHWKKKKKDKTEVSPLSRPLTFFLWCL